MKLQLKHDLEYILNARKRTKRWVRITAGLGAVVAGVTVYALVLPGISMTRTEQTLACPLEVHQHTEDCYGEDGGIICGQADYVVHKHDEDTCYDADGNLVCTLPEVEEHVHDDSCLTQQIVNTGEVGEDGTEVTRLESILTCGKNEVQLHTHSDACYITNDNGEKELTCDMLEVKEHQHGDGCFVTESKDEKADEKKDETTADKSSEAKSDEKKAAADESLSADEKTDGEDEALTGEQTDGSEEVSGEDGKVEDGSEDEAKVEDGKQTDGSEEVSGEEGKVEDGSEEVSGEDGKVEDGSEEVSGEEGKVEDGSEEVSGEEGKVGDGSEEVSGEDETGEPSAVSADDIEDEDSKVTDASENDEDVDADNADNEDETDKKSDEIVAESASRKVSARARSASATSTADPTLPNCQEILDITLGDTVTTPVIESQKRVYYRYVATTAHTVAFVSTAASGDPYGYLYDSNGNQITYNDDINSSNRNFSVSYSLTPGQTYYWGAGYYNTGTGSYPVKLSVTSDHRYVNGKCSVCGRKQSSIGVYGNEDNVTWKLEDGTLYIQGTGAMDNFDGFTVPWASSVSSITNVVIESGVTNVGGSLLKGCTNVETVTIHSTELESVAENAFTGATALKSIVMDTDGTITLSSQSFTELVALEADGKLSYQAPSMFALSESATLGNAKLSAGTYYVNAQGVVYLLKDDGKAALAYCPADVQNSGWSALFQGFTTSDGTAYTVTSIAPYACAGNENLTSITIPASVTSVGSLAFYNCSNLEEVNGADTLAAVYETLSGTFFSTSAFRGTPLYDSQEDVYSYTDGAVSVSKEEANNTYNLQVSAALGTGAEWVDGTTDTLLTGKVSVLKINLDQTGQGVTDTLRVYFYIDDGSSIYNKEENTLFSTEIGVSQTYTRNDGGSVDGTFYRVDDNLFYIELSDIDPGDTLTLYLEAKFPNYSAGGSLLCWVDNSGGTANPTDIKRLNWTTHPDTFGLSESRNTNYTLNLEGVGSEIGKVWLSNLAYTITPNRTSTYDNYGKNPMAYAEYTSTLQFPENLSDGFAWRDGVLDAIREGNWYVTTASSQQQIYVTIEEDGETQDVLLASLSPSSSSYTSNIQHISLSVDEDDNVQIYWQYVNTNTQNEIYNTPIYLNYGSRIIYANVDYLGEQLGSASSLSYSFTNQTEQKQYFCFDNITAGPVNASAVSSSTIVQGNFTIDKRCSTSSVYMGKSQTFYIDLDNSTIFPYTGLTRLNDQLPDIYYLTGSDMQTLFSNATYGEYLTVTVTNAQLCNGSSRSVTATDGRTYTIDQELQGTGTSHSGTSSTDPCKDRLVDMTLAWDGDHLKLSVIEKDAAATTNTYTIGSGEGNDYSSIQAALDDLGILVVRNTVYTCDWDMDWLTLWSGETRTVTLQVSVKSSFQYLTSDTRWYATNGNFTNTNSAKAYYGTGSDYKSDFYYSYVYRDYYLYKSVKLGSTTVTDQTELVAGDVLTYTNNLSLNYVTLDATPLVDKMSGGQVLLLKKSENTSLAGTDWEGQSIDISSLPTRTVGTVEYYVLSTPGTYTNAKFTTLTADTITVKETESSGLETLIYWYLKSSSCSSYAITYQAVIDPSVTQVDADSGVKYYLQNEVWLGDHQSHRLYDYVGRWAVLMSTDKSIVTNYDEIEDGHDPETDELADDSFIHQGETALYRIAISSVGEDFTLTVPGSAMTDTLPGSVSNGWTKDDISITYVTGADSTVTVSDPSKDGWEIVDSTSNSKITTQKIQWNSDFSIQVEGTVYIYVTLTFPDEDDWSEYVHYYGSDTLYNTWKLYSVTDRVTHTLSAQAKAMLQKGVYYTATSTSSSNSSYTAETSADSRLYYSNNTKSYGIVTYYLTLYNSGDTRLYVSKLQDILPKGFTYRGNYTYSDNTNTNYYAYMKTDDQAASVTPVKCYVYGSSNQVSTTANAASAGRQIVTFSISNTSSYSPSISYDTKLGKCYLKPGESLTILYNCNTNGYDDTEDVATNQAAMAYYDYNEGGLQLENDTTFTPKYNTGIIANDGNTMLVGTSQAYSMGFDTNGTITKDTTGMADSAQWLVSQVTMNRGSIMPGIKKAATQTQVHTNDTITWNVTCTNGGTDAMRHYVVTDVMMAPYTFTGSVSYKICNSAGGSIASATLFKISELPDVGEGAKEFENTYFGKYSARLDEDSTGKQVLTIEFLDKAKAAIPAGGGSGILTVDTKNLTTKRESKPYVNQAYLTPVDQAFSKGNVHQGSFTTYKYFGEAEDGSAVNSVSASAQVLASYGYATSAVKKVVELERNEEGDLVEINNNATSSTSTNSIVLTKGEDSIFRYNLTMQNTGSALVASTYMSLYVLVNNLPEVGDHNTFYTQYSRDSEFQVDFYAEDLDPEVTLTLKDGTVKTLTTDQYELLFSTQTDLNYNDGDNADIWNGEELTSADGWYTLEECQAAGTLSSMRTLRVVIKDPDCAEQLMPDKVTIDVAYNAVVHQADDADATEDDDEENLATYSEIAWNSFGYLYEVDGDKLQSAPEKVGVQIPGVPFLQKQLTDNDGRTPFTAKRDETFTFLLYKSTNQSLDSTASLSDLMLELHNKDIPFTVVMRSVAAGDDASESLPLDDMKLYTYDSDTRTCIEGEEDWYWEEGASYTLMELEPEKDSESSSSSVSNGLEGASNEVEVDRLVSSHGEGYSEFSFYSLGGVKTDGLTFQYTMASSPEYVAINHRDTWTLEVDKKERETSASLSGAYFGLYSLSSDNALMSQVVQSYGLTETPDLTKEIDGQTWYLTKIDKSNSNGTITWSGLTEDSYYLVELQAPANYGFIGNGETLVTRVDNQEVTSVTVLNDKLYALPNSGGVGRTLFYLLDAVVVLIAVALLGWKYRKARRS